MSWKKVVSVVIAIPLVAAFGQPAYAEDGSGKEHVTRSVVSGQAEPPTQEVGGEQTKPPTGTRDEVEGSEGEPGAGEETTPGEDPGTDPAPGPGDEPQPPGQDDLTPTPEEPGTETPAPEDPEPETPSPTPQPDTDAPAKTPNTKAPNAKTPSAKTPTSQPAPIESVKLSGVLRIAPAEMAHESTSELAHGSTAELAHGSTSELAHGSTSEHEAMLPAQVKLQTPEGQILPLDPASVDENVSSGDRFTGTIALEAAAQEAVQTEVGASPAAAQSGAIKEQVLEVAAAATVAEGHAFEVEQAEILPAPAAATRPAARMHSMDAVFITTASSSQVGMIRDLIKRTESYWKKESEGLITGIKVNAAVQVKPNGIDVCDPNAAWEVAREQFPGVNHYEDARHLAVFVDKNCGPGAAAGWGDIYTLHGGGETYSNLGARTSGTPYTDALAILAHEFGHNIGLDHSGSRSCNSDAIDTQLSNVWVRGSGQRASGKLCTDDEYRDSWSVMGYYRPDLGSVVPSLPISQKADISVLPENAMRKVTESAGKTQRYTLKALSSGSGLRGIQVQHSGGTEKFYVEYRSGTGQDSGANSMDPSQKGVRILKQYDRGSIVISAVDGYALRKGDSLQPYGGRARVTVESTSSAEAKIRVDFYTSFTDVPTTHKFASQIQWMYDTKMSTGTRQVDGSAVYRPSENVSRSAISAFFFRSEAPKGYKPGAKGKLPFTDVKPGHKFYKEIYWMWESGIATGTKQRDGSTKFMPDQSLSREAMAAFIYRLNGASFSPPAKSPFKDVSPNHKFYKQITWMYAKKVTTGTATNVGLEYRPKGSTSREAMAAFMQRASKL